MNRYAILRLDGDVWRISRTFAAALDCALVFVFLHGGHLDPEPIRDDLRLGCAFECTARDGITYVACPTPDAINATYDGRRVA